MAPTSENLRYESGAEADPRPAALLLNAASLPFLAVIGENRGFIWFMLCPRTNYILYELDLSGSVDLN